MKAYSEDQLIEQPCMDIFQELNWEIANVYEGETFGENGTLGRDSEADVVDKNDVQFAKKFVGVPICLDKRLSGKSFVIMVSQDLYNDIQEQVDSKEIE